MQTVIGKMIAMDEKARKLVQEAEDYRQKILSSAAESKEKQESLLEKEVTAGVTQLQAKSEQQVTAEKAAVKAETDSRIKALETFFSENEDRFVNEIFENTLKEAKGDA